MSGLQDAPGLRGDTLQRLDAEAACRLDARLTAADERAALLDLCRTLADHPRTTWAWTMPVRSEPAAVVALMLTAPGFAEIGFFTLQAHRRHGCATRAVAMALEAAFTGLQVHRLSAVTSADNGGAAAVLERTGFQREGLLRGACLDGQGYHDGLLYAQLAADWRSGLQAPCAAPGALGPWAGAQAVRVQQKASGKRGMPMRS